MFELTQSVYVTIASTLDIKKVNGEYCVNDIVIILKMASFLNFDVMNAWISCNEEYQLQNGGEFNIGEIPGLHETKHMLAILDMLDKDGNHLETFLSDLRACEFELGRW